MTLVHISWKLYVNAISGVVGGGQCSCTVEVGEGIRPTCNFKRQFYRGRKVDMCVKFL